MCDFTCFLIMTVLIATAAVAQNTPTDSAGPGSDAKTSQPWQYGAFIDDAYLLDFNHPANGVFRSRGTTYKLDEPIVNIAAAYLRKSASESSRWGLELTAQAGQDTRVFGFSATAPNLPGSEGLRHLGPTNISYLAPIGTGVTIQGGIFNSLIGYDSLYAKDNFSYTRPWGADFTPYLMMGVDVSYPIDEKLTLAGFVVNDYFHLADPNSVPSWGAQASIKPADHWTLKQTFLIGPHQSNARFEFWRFLSDSIVEWKRDPFTVAFEYQGATEKVDAPGNLRAAWMSAQLPAHWALSKRWSATLRPEVAWDSDGRWTGSRQTVKAVTSTLEYRVPFRRTTAMFRLEHRFDDSRGAGGGFFRGVNNRLTPSQHLLVFAAIFTFDGEINRRNK